MSLDEINLYAFSGKKTDFILSHLEELLKTREYTFALLCCGQNDISALLQTNNAHETKEKMSDKILNHLKSFSTKFPGVKIVFLPLTKRAVCVSAKTRFPESKDDSYIERVNNVVENLSQSLPLHSLHNILIVDGHYLNFEVDLVNLLKADGLHFSIQGLDTYITHCVVKIKDWANL